MGLLYIVPSYVLGSYCLCIPATDCYHSVVEHCYYMSSCYHYVESIRSRILGGPMLYAVFCPFLGMSILVVGLRYASPRFLLVDYRSGVADLRCLQVVLQGATREKDSVV